MEIPWMGGRIPVKLNQTVTESSLAIGLFLTMNQPSCRAD